MISGIELIRAVEATVEEQVREASANRDAEAERVASQVIRAHGGMVSEKQRTELIRALRKKNPLNEVVLAEDFEWLDPLTVAPLRPEALRLLDRLSTETHQARTQAAYISTVLRPFNPKYAFHWLTGREDIVPEKIEPQIAKLERAEIAGTDQLLKWGDEVAELFRELVVIEEGSVNPKTFKPNGTVSSLSSRTYLQSWLSFIKKSPDALLAFAGMNYAEGPDLNQDVDEMQMTNFAMGRERSASAPRPVRESVSSAPRSSVENLSFEEDSDDEPSIQFSQRRAAALYESPAVQLDNSLPNPVAAEKRLGLTLEAELSGEKASCHFESLAEATSGMKNWLRALEAIWGVDDEPIRFHANLSTTENQYSFSLPMEPINAAAERLEFFIQRIQDLK